jgi:GNAT superfamily N-acetyltransferase
MRPPEWHAVRLTFRFARDDDAEVDAVVALVESAYRGDASREGWTTEADLLGGQRTDPDAVRTLLRSGSGGGVLLAFDGTELMGCCHIEPGPDDSAYFGMFAVRPKRQGRGVGKALVRRAEEQARQWGAASVTMTVIRQREDLIAWYGRLGYQPTGERRPFPYGDLRYGEPRRDDLEFVVLSRSLDR